MSGIDIACLFVACDDKLRIFRRYATNDGKGRVEKLKKEGQEVFDIDESLWKWWERELEITSSDRMDLCFIYDTPYEILSPYFTPAKDRSRWTSLGLINELLQRCSLEPRELLPPSGKPIAMDKAGKIDRLHISIEVDIHAPCVPAIPKSREREGNGWAEYVKNRRAKDSN